MQLTKLLAAVTFVVIFNVMLLVYCEQMRIYFKAMPMLLSPIFSWGWRRVDGARGMTVNPAVLRAVHLVVLAGILTLNIDSLTWNFHALF